MAHTKTFAELLADAQKAPAVHPAQDWRVQLEARIDGLTAEMLGFGVEPKFARGAAAALINYPDAPNHGTQGLFDRLYAAGVREAIAAYKVAITEAQLAEQLWADRREQAA